MFEGIQVVLHRWLSRVSATTFNGGLHDTFTARVACVRRALSWLRSRQLVSALVLPAGLLLSSVTGAAGNFAAADFYGVESRATRTTGATPWITLLCKYADIPDEPESVDFVQELFGDLPGQINHYWKQASYGRSSLDGSQVAGWYTLPFVRQSYIVANEADTEKIVQDCARAANNDIDFSGFHGINVFTNGEWAGAHGAAGGTIFLPLDGKERFGFSAIGRRHWTNHGLVVHEMGHGFGLRHSNNSDEDDDPYDNPWSVMSSVHGYAVPHPRYGSLAKHFNAYEKDSLGWFERSEILLLDLQTLSTGSSQSVSLTALGRPATADGTYRMLKLTRGGVDADFYFTLEARERQGEYEAALPDTGVVIHEVDLRTRRAAWIIDEDFPAANYADTDGVVWNEGEIYRGDGFNVSIDSRTGSGYEVTVTATNGSVDGNSVPFIRPFAENQQLAAGDPFQLYLFPVDPDGFAPELISNNLPVGSELIDNDHGSWIFQWTPQLDDVGNISVTFHAIDRVDPSLIGSRSVNLEVIDGSVIEPLPIVSTAPGNPETLLGNVPWVTLLCKFSDQELEPATPAFVQDMFADGIGQINHWWKEVSYNRMNLDGSPVLGWYQLPGPRSDYVIADNSSDDIDDAKLLRDCVAAADADVDLSRYYGVNTFFNSEFNSHGVGFGKVRQVAADAAGLMATTVISAPAWTRQTSVIHEMSLAVGLPLANNSDLDDNTYDNPWTNMSDGQGYAVPDLRYEFLAKHLNAAEKYSLGWFTPDEVIELRVDTRIPGGLNMSLVPLGTAYTDANAAGQYGQRVLILRDPQLGNAVFYTIEAREKRGPYDANLPGTAIIVHEVDLRRSEPAWILYDTSDGSSPQTYAYTDNDMWTVGETVTLPGASVTITSRTQRGFNLYVQTGLEREPSNTSAGSGTSSENIPVTTTEVSEGVDPAGFILGDLPWVTLMCKFADEAEEPESPEFVRELFGDEVGQLDHYWQEQSYGRMSISGSRVWGWYVLPGTRADYIDDETISSAMVDDCISLADADVDFSAFYGVNTFFNSEFNAVQSGFGGKKLITEDDAGIIGYTALGAPTWTWQAAVAHEMARGMGLTLTNNSDLDDNTYDNPWTLMSDSRAYANIDSRFNYIAKHINAHDKEKLGWLDAASVYELKRNQLNNRTTLEIQLDALGEEGDGNHRAIKFIDTTRTDQAVYYLEARTRGGPYDGSLPGSGVLIHEIVSGRAESAWLYHDPSNGAPADYADSPADIWTEGERVLLDGVEVTVARRTDSGYVLRFYSDQNYYPSLSDGEGGLATSPGGTQGSGDNSGGSGVFGAPLLGALALFLPIFLRRDRSHSG